MGNAPSVTEIDIVEAENDLRIIVGDFFQVAELSFDHRFVGRHVYGLDIEPFSLPVGDKIYFPAPDSADIYGIPFSEQVEIHRGWELKNGFFRTGRKGKNTKV
jgi:hypothetical protein